MLSVTSSSSNPMLVIPSDEAMAMYSYNTMNHGFYDDSNQELLTDNLVNVAKVGDRIHGRNGDVRKSNHNASERHRRKKINELYTSLRSLLPASEQSKKMSIPTTVAKVLKYIPELQSEIERMEKKKQSMSMKIHQNQLELARSDHYRHEIYDGSKRNTTQKQSNVSNVSTSKVRENEVVIHVSTSRISVAKILMRLEEEDGFRLISSFSFSDFFEGRFS